MVFFGSPGDETREIAMLLTKKPFSLALGSTLLWIAAVAAPAQAGLYADSSHGDTTNGVDRSTIASGYSAYATGNCAHCHEQHASLGGSEPNPTGGPDVYLGFDLEQDLCLSCHDGSPASTDIDSQFAKTGKHPRLTTDGIHTAYETSGTDFAGTNRHAECTDCHNPHVANAIDAPARYGDAAAAKGPIIGATGVDPTNPSGGGAPSAYTFVTVTDTFEQYKVCYKCHSTWAANSKTTANEFNIYNDSFHNVEGDKTISGYTTTTDAGIASTATFNHTYVGDTMTRYAGASDAVLRTAKMLCSDCHGPSDAGVGPEGVHGSDYNNVLKVPSGSPYTNWSSTSSIPNRNNASSNVWCFNCHPSSFEGSGFDGGEASGTDNGIARELHIEKHDGEACQDCHMVNPHGSQSRRHLLDPTYFQEGIDNWTEGNWSENAHDNDLTATGDNCT